MIKYIGEYSYKLLDGQPITTLMLKHNKYENDSSTPNIIAYCMENRITKDSSFDTAVFCAGCLNRNRTTKPTKEIYKLEEE